MGKKKSSRKVSKKSGSNSAKKTRARRSSNERIDALKAQIDAIRAREKAKEMKDDPCVQQAVILVRSLNKGSRLGQEHGDAGFQHAVADAHTALAGYLQESGLKVPKARRPRGRRAKG